MVYSEGMTDNASTAINVKDGKAVIERDWIDVMDRLVHAGVRLRDMARDAGGGTESLRLRAKADGLSLAYDYLRGYGHHPGGDRSTDEVSVRRSDLRHILDVYIENGMVEAEDEVIIERLWATATSGSGEHVA